MPLWLKRQETWGLVLMAIGLIVCLAVFSGGKGVAGHRIWLAARRAVGIGAYPLALLVMAAGVLLYLRGALAQTWRVPWRALLGGELALLALLGLVHVLSGAEAYGLAQDGRGGGFVGWSVYQLLVPLLGRAVAVILLLPLLVWGVHLMVPLPWPLILWRVRWSWARLGTAIRDRINRRRYYAAQTARPTASSVLRGVAATPPTGRSARATQAASKAAPSAPRAERRAPQPAAAKPSPDLPPLSLLAEDEVMEGDEAQTRYQAEVIEKTLAAFGVPATVVEWNRGPVVTQYGIEPGYIERQDAAGNTQRHKVRVNKILTLHNDLALALAAAPIRIEAPIPGRGLVGIEVPNQERALVGLRGVVAAPEYERVRSNLRMALGRGVSGEPVVADLARMPHLLIAGATGTGKSVCLNAIIASLLLQNMPEELQLLLVDPKRVELTRFNGLPHLLSPALTDIEKVIVSLRWVLREMDRRYKAFAQAGARDLRTYNRRLKARGEPPSPNIVVVIDELADLMLVAADEVERIICRLAQMARATGIHLVIATQRPSVDVVTGLIKANFPARISFAVTSQTDSRVVLDTPGAEKLLGGGDMLFMPPDSAKLLRIQGCFVSDQEVQALVRHWVLAAPQRPVWADQELSTADAPAEAASDTPPWEGMALHDDSLEDDDGLLAQAVAIVREKQQASASFLQRQLRVGYPRAARLMDQLEELGVVGPVGTGGRSRTVIAPSDDGEGSTAASR
jgi:S-DNA-T family DNA segregation ATPase FtsK/SpoIIIE